MAGIGFELRKAIRSADPRSRLHGCLSAAFSTFGATLIGIVILLMLQIAGRRAGLAKFDRDLFMTYVTHSMFLSMLCVSVFSMPQSRYLSDALYEDKPDRVLPTLSGSLILSLSAAVPIMLVFLVLSGTSWLNGALVLMLTVVLCACWILMNDLSLIRDYRQVTVAFVISLAVGIAVILPLRMSGQVTVVGMLSTVIACYSAADVWLYRALYRSFPRDSGTPFAFLSRLWSAPSLSAAGFFSMAGLFGHFFIAWHLAGTRMEGLFSLNLNYDFPAIAAYLTTIPAVIYFVVFFETDFCGQYHRYLHAIGGSSSSDRLGLIREEMIRTMRKNLKNFQAIQLVSTVLAVTEGAKLLDVLNIGMTEQMLDRFRMFCVAYALFTTANMLLLLQMYFMNERNAALSAAVFAAASAGLTAMEIVMGGGPSGLPFAIACSLYLLLNAIQLVRCLNHLEYHILCCLPVQAEPMGGMNLNRLERGLRAMPKRRRGALTRTLAAACTAVIIISGISLAREVDRRSRILTVYPAASDEVLLSPWMGYAPWANSDEGEATASSLVYVELRWADWEPQEGVYDIDFVEQAFRLETYREQGRKVVFRFICDEPTQEEHIDIPEWLFAQTGDGDWYQNEYGTGYSPNYGNETLIAAHDRAIRALGDAYGEDHFFAFVEIGSIGHWGEYHVNYEVGIRRLPVYDTRIRYIRPYLSAFPHAKFLMRYPLLETRKYGFGLYNDMTGDYAETEYWLEQMQGGIWEQTGLPEQAECADSWKTSPVGGEFASSHSDRYFLSAELASTLELLRISHQSFIGPKIIVNESEDDFTAASNAILKTLGYRYRVAEATVDQTSVDRIAFRLVWRNDGAAPVYEDAQLHLLLVEESEGTPLWNTAMPLALRTLNGADTLNTAAEIPRELLDDDMTYCLMAYVSAGEEDLELPLALTGRTEEGWYPLVSFAVR